MPRMQRTGSSYILKAPQALTRLGAFAFPRTDWGVGAGTSSPGKQWAAGQPHHSLLTAFDTNVAVQSD